ncbi:uncharacterized protein LOC130993878 [Salvia miltiorrhiza]|uniref:uncharacterized protein LOC130993878 n=1 Tax=Salvia miltiorrhiza TaxID=226208 RepID=UPI0025AC1101|nr:uncharacterized protein LOC130993878 [Salvia miltiorrhiza]
MRNSSTMTPSDKVTFAKIWATHAPHKAKITVWRTLRNRLPTCNNLKKRNIPLDEVDSMCNACFSHNESINHVFLRCQKTEMVWDELQNWLGTTTVRPNQVSTHFSTFSNLGKGKRSGKFLASMWMCTIWQLWKERNDSRFEGKQRDVKSMIAEIKTRMWSWNKIFDLLDQEQNLSLWCSQEISTRIV